MRSKKNLFQSVRVSKQSIDLLHHSIEESYQTLANPEVGIKVQLDRQLAIRRIKTVTRILKNKKNTKVLDLGCGAGYLVAFLNKNNIDTYGIEPDKGSFAAAQSLLKENRIKSSRIKNMAGESFGFREKFDLIVSFQVIEHTQDPLKVFQQCHKQLKKDGKIYFIVPNYHSFWEGHYGILWLPWLNKKTAKFYVRLFNKTPNYIDTLQFITPKKIRQLLNQTRFELISLGESKFNQRMGKANFMPFGHTGKLLPILSFLKKIKLNRLIAKISLRTDTFYPLIVYAKRKG